MSTEYRCQVTVEVNGTAYKKEVEVRRTRASERVWNELRRSRGGTPGHE